MNRSWLILLISLLIPAIGFGFTFTVASTPENCSGNGSLQFTASNADPNGSIVYEVYRLPNTSVPIATVTANSLSGLSAGNYIVKAKETVGNIVTTQQQDATIAFEVVPLIYDPDSINQACSSNSNIVINVISGVAVSYEIFSGPVLFPPQTSNTFANVPVGVYKIRVFDNCGSGVVTTYTVNLNPAGLIIGAPSFNNTNPPSCNFTVANHTITPATGTVIGYPLQIRFTVHPPGGGPDQIFNSTLSNGDPNSQAISETIPAFPNQNYNYDVTITDSCGSTFTTNFIVNQTISLQPTIFELDCNTYYFELLALNSTPPYTLNFINVPAGFSPAAYNSGYPGPYNLATTVFGSASLQTTIGTYDVTITDICGRTNTISFSIVNIPAVPSAEATNNGCASNSGKIVVKIESFRVVAASVLAAPADYPFPLPHDVSGSINTTTGILTLDPVPLGSYSISTTDDCGQVLAPLNVIVPPYADQGLSSDLRPGCDQGKSAIKIFSKNTGLSTLSITAAPTEFPQALPYDATVNITPDGIFYMNGLPSGNYTFRGKDQCNFTNDISLVIDGYSIITSNFSLEENCGSFDVPLEFVSNATTNQSFWLQKLIDAPTNTWGHPGTLIPYTEGSIPNSGNSYPLNNNATNFNLNFNGTLRIVRSFATFNNGADFNTGTATSVDKDCIEILSPTLFFNQVLEITDAHRMPCSSSGSLDVIVDANGTAPIHYTIIEKDGVPFNLDNGNSNVFPNLAAGIYIFQVQDNCGNIVNRLFDVNSLLSLVTITKPNDITDCLDVVTGNETFDLTTQNAIILGAQLPANYTLTYHQSTVDVQNNANPIQNLTAFNPDTNPKTIYVRLVYNPLPNCFETTSFELFVGQNPILATDPNYLSCSSSPITIDVAPGNLPTTTYLWSDGSAGSMTTVSQIGVTNLSVTATNTYSGTALVCTTTKDIQVIISEPPVIDYIDVADWTYDANSITVVTSNNGSFEYSLDGNNYQEQNIFSHLQSGVYTVFVRDKFKCNTVQQEVWILYYPNFFTPNNDGYNDTWFIENSDQEPELNVYIYDRYGKIMQYLDAKTKNWNGTYNGHQAVSTDYWFVVTRQDGRVHKGHFSLKR